VLENSKLLQSAHFKTCFVAPCAVTPPGFYTSNGTTQLCPAGSFRANWTTGSAAAACQSCGEGVRADKTEQLAVYSLANNTQSFVAVATSPNSCCKCNSWLQKG
jgi:hypothetical protein